MIINLKVKTLDARTHDFSVDNELTIQQFKEQVAEKTNIAAENQRIIYQGRVLSDEKQLKEYDVDGKVLHVAERPPFSQRGSNSTNNDEPMRSIHNIVGLPTPRNLRNAPYFRALDGMLVGTMAIPVNNGPLAAAGNRTPPNRFPNSSSFCINRITVAQHMINCANNIAAYLENPEIGLNNQPLDILQRGHWTMESTVVEVGVSSADMPRNNNIIDMVQDAVTAALSRNTPGRNYTVVQLPTVYTNENGNQQQQQRDQQQQEHSQPPQEPQRAGNDSSNSSGAAASSDTSEETTAAAAVIIEDVIESDDETADGGGSSHGDDDRSNSPQATNEGIGEAGATAAGEPNETQQAGAGIGPRRRTRPQVLANVFQRYRTVEARLAPFLDLYNDILQQDPNFDEQDQARREDTQRIFDRVSEALHYLSHAQHAISDLMLDLSQPGPRVLTCRPILVEQSGYIRSNNIFTPNMVATPLAELIPQVSPAAGGTQGAASTAAPTAGGANTNGAAAGDQPEQGPFGMSLQQEIIVDVAGVRVPIDLGAINPPIQQDNQEPATRTGTAAGATTGAASEAQEGDEHEEQPARGAEASRQMFRLYLPVPLAPSNPETPMSLLIQTIFDASTNQDPNRRNVNGLTSSTAAGEADATIDAATASQTREQNMLGNDNLTDESAEADAAAAEITGLHEPSVIAGTARQARQDMDEHVEQPAEGVEAPRPRFRLYMPVPLPTPNPQVRMARMIQAVVNNATNDADLGLEFNVPNVVPINLPVHVLTAAVNPLRRRTAANDSTGAAEGPSAAAAATTRAAAAAGTQPPPAGAAASTSTGTRSGDQRANTLPTTATQTRSTSRPQIQIGGNNNWAGRIAPTHTAFDRFLPCNSHHIREPEHNNNNNNNHHRDSTHTGTALGGSGAANVSGRANASSTVAEVAVDSVGSNAPTSAFASVVASAAASASASAPAPDAAPASSSPSAAAGATSQPDIATSSASASGASASASGTAATDAREASVVRAQLRGFLHRIFFQGLPVNADTISQAIIRAVNWFSDVLLFLPQYELPEYNSVDSACNAMRPSMHRIIKLCYGNSCSTHFEHQLKQILDQFRKRLYSVLFVCLGSVNAEIYWRHLMMVLIFPLNSNFCNEAFQFLRIFIDPALPVRDTSDAQQFVVVRNAQASLPVEAADTQQPSQVQLQQHAEPQLPEHQSEPHPELQLPQLEPVLQTLVADVEMGEVASGSTTTEVEPPLPAVVVGSEPWHNNFPNDWLPVITRDLQTQSEQNRPQPPYSDAYISGMSAKRRKIIQSEKPTNVECMIASGVQRALQSSGLTGAANGGATAVGAGAAVAALTINGGVVNPNVNPDVINAIAHDAVVQASYTEAVRNNARERLKQDIDYKPSKYPQIAKFTEQK